MNQAERDLKRLRELCMEHGCGHVLMIFDGSYGVGAPSSAPSETLPMPSVDARNLTGAVIAPSATPRSTRRVVCAAIRDENGNVICGPRHFDAFMHRQLAAYGEGTWNQAEQGFIDQRGEWLSREEAHKVATEAGQIIRRCGGDDDELFSENLY